MGVFKLYDIRGIYGIELTDELVFKIGLALGKFFENYETIGIVRDIRLYSERMRNILVSALTHTHNILDFGLGSTPEAHYLAKVYNMPVLMITASHSPKEYDGIKMIKPTGLDVEPEEVKLIEKLVNNVKVPSDKVGIVEEEKSAIEIYIWYMRKRFRNVKGYRIGYDPSNSVMVLMKEILTDLGNEVIVINGKLDGNFPAHNPDPADPKNVQQLQNLVKDKKLDFGFIFDGDGDRLGIVDSNGNLFTMDKYIMPFIKKEKKYILEISLPIYLRTLIKQEGGEAILSRPGHSYIINECLRNNAYLGIEITGHIYHADNGYIDDALYAGLKLIKYFKEKNMWFEDIKVPEYKFLKLNVEMKEDWIKKGYLYAEKYNYEINTLNNTLDGVELLKENKRRILIRYAQTEPYYRVEVETYDNEDPNRIYEEILKI